MLDRASKSHGAALQTWYAPQRSDPGLDPRTELLVDARRRLGRETNLSSAAIETEIARILREGRYRLPDTSKRLVRKAVTTFEQRAQLDVRTGPGRRTTSSPIPPGSSSHS